MKRLSSILIALATTVLPAWATEGDTVRVVFKGTTATVTIPQTASVTSAVTGARVVLTSSTTTEEYVYDVSGTTTNGSLIITGDYKLTLRLNGVSIKSNNGSAIDVVCGKRIAVELVEGTTNTLADAVGGSQKGAFYTKGHAEFQGGGTLNVTGNSKHAICAKEYLELKKSLGAINVLSAVSDGIHCGKGTLGNANNYFKMNGGVVNIANVGSDGIDSDDYGTIMVKGGSLNLNVDALDVVGLKADSTLTIAGGTVNISVTGQESSGIRSNWETYFEGGTVNIDVQGNGSKGIKGKMQTVKTVNNGGSVYLKGGEINILVGGATVYAANDTTKCMGMSVDANLTQAAGAVSILACGPEAYTYNVKGTEVLADSFIAIAVPWTYAPYSYQYDMTAYVSLTVNGAAIDCRNLAVGAFVGDECRGVGTFTQQQGYTWSELRIRSNVASGEKVVFKAYNPSTGVVYACAETCDFVSQSVVGVPSNPFVLTAAASVQGDVNGDGSFTLADVTALIDAYQKSEYKSAGDMDNDGKLTLADVKALLLLYLSTVE